MRILLISEYFGTTAPGIVAEKTAVGLSEYADIDIITSDYHPKRKGNFHLLKCIPMFRSFRLEQLSWSKLKTNVFAELWVSLIGGVKGENYDLIFSIVSMGHFCTLELGEKIKRKYSIPFFAYFVDAIPAPDEYLTAVNVSYTKMVANYATSHCSNVDVVFSTCKEMSEYQKNRFAGQVPDNIVYEELLNPSDFSCIHTLENNIKKGLFVYAGGLYGLRTPKYLFEAFEHILQEYPYVKLVFVGTRFGASFDSLSDNVKEHIEILPYTRNLEPVYSTACCLIDIATNVNNDIFMSCKLTSYCSYNRPIICESSVGSPSRRVFGGLKSVIHCGHNSDELYSAMKTVLENIMYDYGEREELLKNMTIQSSAAVVMSHYEYLNQKLNS